MPYTYNYAVDSPAGSDAVNVPQDITNFKHALKERFEGTLIVSVDDDPWVLAPGLGGALNDRTIYIPGYNFLPDSNGDALARQSGYYSGSANAYCPMKLPLGVTVTRVRLLYHDTYSGTMTAYFRKCAFNVGVAVTTIWSANCVNGIVGILDSGAHAISEVVDASMYSLDIGLGGGSGNYYLYGVELTVDIPGNGSVV